MATVVPVSGVDGAAGRETVCRLDRPDHVRDHLPDARRAWVESVKNQFIAPTHPGQDIEYVAVTTPKEFWPITGLFRLLGLALGPPRSSGLVAQRGRTSRGGNSRGSSTSPPISRCRPGWPIWRRRWPSTPTTIW